MNDRTRLLIETCIAQGWTVTGGGSHHYKCIPPDKSKPMVVLAASVSDSKAWLRARSFLRRSGLKI